MASQEMLPVVQKILKTTMAHSLSYSLKSYCSGVVAYVAVLLLIMLLCCGCSCWSVVEYVALLLFSMLLCC